MSLRFYVLLCLVTVTCGSGRRVVTSDTGILAEWCEEDREVLEDMLATVGNTSSGHRIWTVGCHRYIEMANHMRSINQSGISRLIVVARRDSLRFVESMLAQSNVARSMSITTNNEVMVAGKVQSAFQRKNCKERAGGKQFWGLVISLLPDVIDYWQWRNLYLYVDEVYGLSEAKQVYEAFLPYQKVASLKTIATTRTTSVDEFLRQMSHFERGVREVKAIIVICGRTETLDLVEKAALRGLFTTYYRWLIFDSGSQKLLDNMRLQFDTDVIVMRHKEPQNVTASVMRALLATPVVRNSSSEPEVAEEDDKTCDSATPVPGGAPLSAIALNRRNLPQDFQLEFFRVRKRVGAVPGLRSIGLWTPEVGMKEMRQDLAPDLDGVVFQVVTLHCPPYVTVTKGRGGNVTFEGYLVDLLDALAKIMNFRYNITLPYDHTYGRCEEGICTGIIGFLVRKEADLALANLTPTGSRVRLMDFTTTPIDKAGLSILFRRPTKTDDNIINAYFMPFSVDVTICVGVTIPTLGAFLYLMLKFGHRLRIDTGSGRLEFVLEEEEEEDEDEPEVAKKERLQASKDDQSFGRCLFAALQSFGQQGIDVVPVTASGRVTFGLMWLFSLFVMSAYTANLISYFTATFVAVPFRSLEEVFSSRKYRIGFLKGTTYMDDIEGENGTVLVRLWRQLERQKFSTLVEDLDEGIERIRNERYILMHEARVLEHLASKDCEFATLNERYLSAPMMLAFQKGSQFKRPVSDMLLKMTESGLLERLKNRWWPPTMDCSLAAQTFQSISLWGMTSIFGVLASGLLLGAAIMLLEKAIKAQRIRARLRSIAQAIPDNLPSILGRENLNESI